MVLLFFSLLFSFSSRYKRSFPVYNMREDLLLFVSPNGRFECPPVTASSKG
jgi:hypothetical protein